MKNRTKEGLEETVGMRGGNIDEIARSQGFSRW